MYEDAAAIVLPDCSRKNGADIIGAANANAAAGTSNAGFQRSITTIGLMLMTFLAVAGGPYGYEAAVAEGGPLLTIFLTVFIPLVWAWYVRAYAHVTDSVVW